MARRPRRRRRLSAVDGRQVLLDAGRELAYEQSAGKPLDHIRVTDVAARAGVTIGAVYHYWDSQDAYREDLLDELFSPSRYPASAEATEVLGELAEDRAPVEELVRRGAAANVAALKDNPDLRVTMGLWAADEDDINKRIGAQYRVVGERWAALYEAMFREYGLEIRPPFTMETMAALFTALAEGLTVRASVDPGSVPREFVQAEDGDARWELLGCAILALLPALSRDEGSDEDLFELIDRLRASGEQFTQASAHPFNPAVR